MLVKGKAAFTMLVLSPVVSAFIALHPSFRTVHHAIASLQHTNSRSRSQLFAATSESDDNDKNANSKGMTTLHFTGESIFQSDPLPYESAEDLANFLENEKKAIHSILLNGHPGGKNKVVPVELDNSSSGSSVMNAWRKQCLAVGGEFLVDMDLDGEEQQTNDDSIVYQVNGGGFNMGGLVLKNEMLIGATTTLRNENENEKNDTSIPSPEYQFVFIRDKRVAEGHRLLVWVYNKLMGGSGKEEAESAITSLTRFYPQIDTEKKEVVFTTKSFLDIAVKFPSLLLKILPVSKEKAEEEGSASIMKTLVKDTEPIIPVLMEFYRQHLSKNGSANAGTKDLASSSS